MNHLNQQATEIFARLIDQTQEKRRVVLTENAFIKQVFDRVTTGTQTEYGLATLYRLGHIDGNRSQNRYMPEIRFLVADNRKDPAAKFPLVVFPVSYYDPEVFRLNISVLIKYSGAYRFYADLLDEQISIAQDWLIRLQNENLIP